MSTISLFLLVIFWACMFVSDARTESTDSSTYYYEGSENDDASGDYYDGLYEGYQQGYKDGYYDGYYGYTPDEEFYGHTPDDGFYGYLPMMILIIFMRRTAYIINKEMTAGESV